MLPIAILRERGKTCTPVELQPRLFDVIEFNPNKQREQKRRKMRFLVICAILLVGFSVVTKADEDDEYIYLPGKSCDDAPPCPDDRPCVMGKPQCNVGTCPDVVPTCGTKP